jgi:hypothetical protein
MITYSVTRQLQLPPIRILIVGPNQILIIIELVVHASLDNLSLRSHRLEPL